MRQAAQARVSKKVNRARRLLELKTVLSELLAPSQVQFVMSQVHQSGKSLQGRRWTQKDKTLALSLFHSSPKTYKMLRKIFALPSVTTLRTIVAKVDIAPGFSKNILEALRLKTQNLTPCNKLVCLALDEMVIKEGVSYDKHNDALEGLVHTTERGEELANHALVFMVRGLLLKWKCPLGYFLSNGTMKATVMKQLLLQAVSELHAIGLTTVVLVSDVGPNNVSMFETKLNVSVRQPFFTYQDSKALSQRGKI